MWAPFQMLWNIHESDTLARTVLDHNRNDCEFDFAKLEGVRKMARCISSSGGCRHGLDFVRFKGPLTVVPYGANPDDPRFLIKIDGLAKADHPVF